MRTLNILVVWSSAPRLPLLACIVATILASTGRTEQPADKDTRWLQSRPDKIVWSSEGSANVLKDNSVQLLGSNVWQEFTLYFQLRKIAKVKRIRLEVLPSARSNTRVGHRLVLFDVKPHLENHENGTTRLEFQDCRFLGNEDDETAANCIDFLSDTGWTVPEFVGDNACHRLVLELREPIAVEGKEMFAITIDSGGATDLQNLSRIRISFSDTEVLANQNNNAVDPSTQSRGN